ncbi:hypothetical protein C5S53_09520 [Methanophagales archaeon]|nr:hypothetical protein C5S53_09520 [Methanophagales archaeon]
MTKEKEGKTSVEKVTVLNANISLECKSYTLPVRILRNIFYIDPAKVVSGELEIGAFELGGQVCLVSVKVEKSQVVGLSLLGVGVSRVSSKHPIYGPFLKAAWKEEGVDIEKLDTSPVSVEDFIKGLQTIPVPGLKEVSMKEWVMCYCNVNVFDMDEFGVFVCVYLCGHFVECVLQG